MKKTTRFLSRAKNLNAIDILRKYGEIGVNELANATPVDSGITATSWGYEIVETDKGYKLEWTNDNINDGCNIAVLIQYGHGTGTGGYVEGVDYINPALRDVFDSISRKAWEEVSK